MKSEGVLRVVNSLKKIINECVDVCMCVGEERVEVYVCVGEERVGERVLCVVKSLKKIISVCEGVGMIMCVKNKTLMV